MPQYVKAVILVPGSGTIKERKEIAKLDHVGVYSVSSIEESARLAFEKSEKGDRILFSPGFEARGMDSSRKDRGERFVKAVRAL